MKTLLVGGPGNGRVVTVEPGCASRVCVPVPPDPHYAGSPGDRGFGAALYQRTEFVHRNRVHVIFVHGGVVDPVVVGGWIEHHKLKPWVQP